MKKDSVSKLVLLFIIISPLLDMLVTVTSVPISLVVRGLFFILAIVYLIKERIDLKYLIFLILMMIVYFSYSVISLNYGIVSSVSVTLKLFYLPITAMLLNNLDCDKNKILKSVLISFILYTGIFIISYITKTGYSNYLATDGKTGFRGLFNSINELSATLIVLYFYVIKYLKNNKILLFALSFALLIVVYLSSTKVMLFGVLLVILYYVLPILIKKYKGLKLQNKILSLVGIVVIIFGLTYLFTLTDTYHNMLIQAEFFKVDNIFSFNGINRVIFNDRLTFLTNMNSYFINSNLISKLLGIGFNVIDIKIVEIDIFDIFYCYGIISLIVLGIGIYLYIKNNRLKRDNLFIMMLLLLISMTSGHVLLYPAVSIYFGIIMFINKNEG